MDILVFSDIHLDAVTAGRERRAEVREFLGEVFRLAATRKTELVMFAGDAHDPGAMFDALYTSELIRTMSMFVTASWNPIFVAVAGNHDVVDTSELFMGSPLTTLTPLRAACSFLTSERAERVHIFDRPFTRRINNEYAVLGLPYVSRAHSSLWASWEAHAFETAKEYVGRGMRLIVVGHRVIPGAQLSSETAEMARGQDQLFPLEEVRALNPYLMVNGHYHIRQEIPAGADVILVPGSPLSFTFTESEDVRKGVYLVDICDG